MTFFQDWYYVYLYFIFFWSYILIFFVFLIFSCFLFFRFSFLFCVYHVLHHFLSATHFPHHPYYPHHNFLFSHIFALNTIFHQHCPPSFLLSFLPQAALLPLRFYLLFHLRIPFPMSSFMLWPSLSPLPFGLSVISPLTLPLSRMVFCNPFSFLSSL